jgi:sulfur-oxidizing protein SoxY
MFERARRRFLAGLTGLAALALAPMRTRAAENDLGPLIASLTGGAAVREGRVRVDTPPLADNGHSVPLKVSVESPMSAEDHVVSISILSERNPRPLIATYYLGPRAGRATIATRVRLNGTQRVHAIAKLSDGSFWSAGADVIVTESACLDDS